MHVPCVVQALIYALTLSQESYVFADTAEGSANETFLHKLKAQLDSKINMQQVCMNSLEKNGL